MAINNINSWERWGFLTGLCFVVSRRNSAKKDSRSEGRERAEEWEIQRNTKTERAGCDLNPRLGKKESHALWIMHTHNTHIWSIQFLLPISEDKYDGCKLHTVNLVFHIVYMRWVSTPVNYSADYSELPFINEGCGCLVGLIHESSPPSRVISRLFGFFCQHVREAMTFPFWMYYHLAQITSVNFPRQMFWWHRQEPSSPHTVRAACRGLLGASVPVTLHASHYMSHLPARTPF